MVRALRGKHGLRYPAVRANPQAQDDDGRQAQQARQATPRHARLPDPSRGLQPERRRREEGALVAYADADADADRGARARCHQRIALPAITRLTPTSRTPVATTLT